MLRSAGYLAAELGRWALRRRRPFRVSGHSMGPTLVDGELVLIDPNVVPRVGDIAVARHPAKELDVIKTVTEVSDDGTVTLWSPRGAHSGQFGPVALHAVHGQVTISLTRLRRLPSATHPGS